MNNFVYHNPTKVLFGKGTISKIGAEIKEFNAKKVLMLYGMKSIFKKPLPIVLVPDLFLHKQQPISFEAEHLV